MNFEYPAAHQKIQETRKSRKSRKKRRKKRRKYINVIQRNIEYAKKGQSIGSFGAESCVIMVIYNENVGTILGHIDAITDLNYIENILNIHKTKFNYNDVSIYLTTGLGIPYNKKLRKKLNKLLKKYTTIKPEIINSTQLLIEDGQIKTDFDIHVSDSDISKMYTMYERFMKITQLQKNDTDIYVNKMKSVGLYENEIYRRPPYPNDGKSYIFNYKIGEWIIY